MAGGWGRMAPLLLVLVSLLVPVPGASAAKVLLIQPTPEYVGDDQTEAALRAMPSPPDLVVRTRRDRAPEAAHTRTGTWWRRAP